MLFSLFIFQKCLSDNFKVQSSKFKVLKANFAYWWKLKNEGKKKKKALANFQRLPR